MGYNLAKKKMITPKTKDYKKIQSNIAGFVETHMSSTCSCSCNCTCGCNCNAPVLQSRFSDSRRIID